MFYLNNLMVEVSVSILEWQCWCIHCFRIKWMLEILNLFFPITFQALLWCSAHQIWKCGINRLRGYFFKNEIHYVMVQQFSIICWLSLYIIFYILYSIIFVALQKQFKDEQCFLTMAINPNSWLPKYIHK